jgi:hypothetical protein
MDSAHRKLIVWRESTKMVEMVYDLTRSFPHEERLAPIPCLRILLKVAPEIRLKNCYTTSALQTARSPDWTLSSKSKPGWMCG